MTEFMHEVVARRERRQAERSSSISMRNIMDEMERRMQSYVQTPINPTIPVSYGSNSTVTYNRGAISQLFGIVYVRSRSYNAVDEYIRRNAEAHNDWFVGTNTMHTHGDTQRWVLDEVSSVFGGRRQFSYSCYECGATCLAGESIPREAVIHAGV